MGAQGGDLTRPCASLLRVFFDRVVDRVGAPAAHGGDREHHSADHQGLFIAVAGRIAFRQLHELKIMSISMASAAAKKRVSTPMMIIMQSPPTDTRLAGGVTMRGQPTPRSIQI